MYAKGVRSCLLPLDDELDEDGQQSTEAADGESDSMTSEADGGSNQEEFSSELEVEAPPPAG